MSDLAERLREDPTLYAYIAADRIEELEAALKNREGYIEELEAELEAVYEDLHYLRGK
jgi:hypothetical protein